MFTENDYKNCQIDLSEMLKRIRTSVCSIRQTIDYINVRQQNAGEQEPHLLEYIYEVMASLSQVLKYSCHHAKNQDEIHDVRQTQDILQQAGTELEQKITRMHVCKMYTTIHNN